MILKPITRKNNLAPYFMLVKNMNYILNAHREIEIVIVLSGELTVTIENKVFNCVAGDVIFVHEFAIHGYTTSVNSIILGCSFRKEFSDEIRKYVSQNFSKSFVYHNPKSKDRILELANWINETKHEATEIQQLAYLFFVFGYLSEDSMVMVARDQKKQIIVDVLQYIDENVDRDIDLEKLCFDLGVSKYYISHLFKQDMGYSIMNYFMKLKLAGSKRILLETDYKITDIVKYLGFGSVRTFNRLFVDNFGVSPSKFREQNNKMLFLEISSVGKEK